MSRHGQMHCVWHRIGAAMSVMVIVIGSATFVSLAKATPVHAGSDTYPWSNAVCVTPNPNAQPQDCTGSVAYDNWGYSMCPANDSNCTRLSGTLNGTTYGESDPWGEYLRNCTSYVAWMLHSQNGFEMPFFDDAVNWGSKAQNLHYAVDMNPKPGSVFWDSGHDHVGWVESVSTDGTQVTYEDYNSGYNGVWGEHIVATSSASGYIHFKDVTSGGGSGGGTTTGGSINWSGNFATSWGSGRLDIFTHGSSNSVSHLWYGNGWGPWDSMPVLSQQATSWPSAVSWGPGRIDLFATAPNGNLLQAYYDGSWHNWTAIGGANTCITGAPGVSSWGPNRLDVFAQLCQDNGNHLAHIYFDGAWHGWEDLPVTGYQMASAPSAVSWGPGRIDVFAQSTSNGGRPIQAYFDSSGWHGWVPLGDTNTCITGAPGVSTWGVNRLDLFTQGCGDNGNSLWHAYFDGSWHWETITPTQQITTSPSAVSWSQGRIDVFAGSTSGTLLHRYWDSTGWHDWEDKGGSLAG